MNKLFLCLALLIACPGMYAQDANDVNMLKRLYRTVENDLSLIKKCYFSKSPACTKNEREAAQNAMLRVGAEIAGLAATIAAAGMGAYVIVKKLRKPSDSTQSEKPAQPQEPIVQPKPEPKRQVSSAELFNEIFNIVPEVISVTAEKDTLKIELPEQVYRNLTDEQRGMLSGRVYDLTDIGNIEYHITP